MKPLTNISLRVLARVTFRCPEGSYEVFTFMMNMRGSVEHHVIHERQLRAQLARQYPGGRSNLTPVLEELALAINDQGRAVPR